MFFGEFINVLEREEHMSRWSSGLDFFIALETLKRFLDGHVADIRPDPKRKDKTSILPTWLKTILKD